MRLAWEEFMLWVEDNQEGSAMIRAFLDKVNSRTFDFKFFLKIKKREFNNLLQSLL